LDGKYDSKRGDLKLAAGLFKPSETTIAPKGRQDSAGWGDLVFVLGDNRASVTSFSGLLSRCDYQCYDDRQDYDIRQKCQCYDSVDNYAAREFWYQFRKAQ
ncbi:unnamed protein product, partial [Prorocentrum cordatum]